MSQNIFCSISSSLAECLGLDFLGRELRVHHEGDFGVAMICDDVVMIIFAVLIHDRSDFEAKDFFIYFVQRLFI